MNSKLVLSSGNKNKVEEIKAILKDEFDIITKKDIGLEDLEVEETGKSFYENAYIKAKAILDRSKLSSLADDSGLEVEALNGEPSIYSSRYAGEEGNDSKNNQKLLESLKEVPLEKRDAKFVSVIVLILENGEEIVGKGELHGKIAFDYKGEGGFGYDPIFLLDDGRHLAELSLEEKNNISHRKLALEDLLKKIKKMKKSID